MPKIVVTKELDATASAVWKLLANFGDVSWIPVADRVDVDGDGVGMRRLIHGAGDQPVIETLTYLNPERMEVGYSIANNPLPVARFDAVVAVRPTRAGSAISWEVDYEPLGSTDADAQAARDAVEAVYEMMAGWLADVATTRIAD
ncbi:hypothetical protein BRW65_24245 [Mycobacterium paraffinicum]|uniref:MxaD family protein n=1 Tax=Mycobacterium paraffinicum TaxID=53378 RepID=A0A1Q4HNH3_9MYCO|nr:SRPBCC family protein [Mycobacterium paraffinicum]OJZ68992.1 hypothetical protein BRW65_24245 [Mycobacterium paraffinicum]